MSLCVEVVVKKGFSVLFVGGVLGLDLLLGRVLRRWAGIGSVHALRNGLRPEPGVFLFKESDSLKHFRFRGRGAVGEHGLRQFGSK